MHVQGSMTEEKKPITRRDVVKKADGSLDWSQMSIGIYDLWYPGVLDEKVPPTSEGANVIEISLVHVRAARAIRIHFDFERDGYIISANVTDPDTMTDIDQERRVEKAYVEAWKPEDV